jgi:P4 family phage/plasmid primase-like protien
LRNIDDRLYDEFLDFSKKSYKYDEYACDKYWNDENKSGKQYTMGSLKYWAKQDNPDLYASMSKDQLRSLINQSRSGTEYDVARVVEYMYKDQFVFDAGQKTWFQFKNHKWNSITNAYTLQLKLPTEVADTYRASASYYQAKASSPDVEPEEKERLDQVVIAINKIVTNLKKVGFQVNVLSQCALLFAQEKILENMDEKRNLLCFNNGVYDLDIDEFRDGRPDDWITYSVGYDYDKNVNDEIQDRIWDFLVSIQDTHENANFLVTTLGMMVHGTKERDTFIIWRGEGGNGKGILSILLSGAFGQYFEAPDISLYTTKKTSSSSASSELVKCKAKRCICSSEAEEGSTIQVAFVKTITGDDNVTCRALYKEPISFKFQAYPLIMTNPKPALSGVDGGVKRRLIMIPFNNNFVEDPIRPNERLIDLSIRKEFKETEYYQQFMLILIKAYQEYRDRGFSLTIPDNVKKETDEYFNDNNHIYNFINDTYEIAPKEMRLIAEFESNSFKVLSDTVKQDFKQWCKKEGIVTTVRPADFFKAVIKELTGMNRFCEKLKCTSGAWRNKHVIYGIKCMLDTYEDNCQIRDDYD